MSQRERERERTREIRLPMQLPGVWTPAPPRRLASCGSTPATSTSLMWSTTTLRRPVTSPSTSCSGPASWISCGAATSTSAPSLCGVPPTNAANFPTFADPALRCGPSSGASTMADHPLTTCSRGTPEKSRKPPSGFVSLGTPFGAVGLQHGPTEGNQLRPSAALDVGGPSARSLTTFSLE